VYVFGAMGTAPVLSPASMSSAQDASPIESIRLKLSREGLEDYEYLVLLDKLDGSQSATKAVNSFIRHLYDF
jgi:gentisate 1,2-dioxygenase